MARLDLYRLPKRKGFALDVQVFNMEKLGSRVVVPLLPASDLRPIKRLNPIFMIDGEAYVMVTQAITTVPTERLGPVVGALSQTEETTVIGALDYLLSHSS
ncbi:MAG: CcdB family protein [Magnetospirillum sp.]|nr:CcdB family protein [Magnetospirillum sp.]